MRLDEWQRYIDSEFVEGAAAGTLEPPTALATPPTPQSETPAAAPAAPEIASPPAASAVTADVPSPQQTVTTADVSAPILEPVPVVAPTNEANTVAEAHGAPSALGRETAIETETPPVSAQSAEPPPATRPVAGTRPRSPAPAHVAPFAEYIAVRSADSDRPPTLDLEFPPGADAPPSADAHPFEGSVVATHNLPLIAAPSTLAVLSLGGSAQDPVDRESSARIELLARLCDPEITLVDAALLLRQPLQQVYDSVRAGALTGSSEPTGDAATELRSLRVPLSAILEAIRDRAAS